MTIPAELLRIDTPGVYALSIFVGGTGQSFQRDFTVAYGSPLAPVDLTGITPSAEVRSLDDATLLATITAAVVSPASAGIVRLTMTPTVADAIAWPAVSAPNGSKIIRGRWHLALTEGAARVVVLRGDCEVTR